MKRRRTKQKPSISDIKAGISGEGLSKKYNEEPPLRSELFSVDQMEYHGKTLAGLHITGLQKTADQHMLKRLAENDRVLHEVYSRLSESAKAKQQVTPAGAWLLDNFYLIEEHIHTGKRHLPKGYSRELPRLLNGPSKGLPRVYNIALETIAHGDGRVDPERLSRFVAAYQTVTPLKLGELWAIPIMLRLALIENLRRVSTHIADSSIDRGLANAWADKMLDVAAKDPKNLILVISDMARSKPPMTTAFVSEFARRLQGRSPALALPLTWIEYYLSESGRTIEQLVHLGNQQLAANQLSISNSIDSLRFLGATDWKEFVETMSVVEQTLRHDPHGSYVRMDFATRDRYRHVVEKIGGRTHFSEVDIAQKAITMAEKSFSEHGYDNRKAHVGYYLIDKGLPELEQEAEVRFSLSRFFQKAGRKYNLLLFIGSILLFTSIITTALLIEAKAEGIGRWALVSLGILLFLCSWHLSLALVNWLATLIVKPVFLPRMDFSHGIPIESRTLVVVPAMLISPDKIDDLTEALEVRFLANRDKNLHFCLLADFQDADNENLPEDIYLSQYASKKIKALNKKYKDSRNETFFLFQRPRIWNESEKIWMGYERKRGKLSDLNSFLANPADNHFSNITGKTTILSNVRYIITLDSDTQLPRDSARQFAGTMSHPLNRAIIDTKKRRVCEGYGILQPQVAVSLAGSRMSRYNMLQGSEPGIDPYTRTVSDVYQDVFGEGSFIGKGIYDVDIFRRVLKNRFPENLILSHDLLEGCYLRSGLISDVQLFEEHPSLYLTDVKRRHRWIRGDWQIIHWLFFRVPGMNGVLSKNPISALSRWKILDNLRRSVTSFLFILLLLLGWFVLPQAWFWTLTVLGIIMVPSLVISILDMFNKKKEVHLKQHISASLRSAGQHFSQAAFMFTCLPFEAYYSLDALTRTLWRLLFSHKHLMEWNLAGRADIIEKHPVIETLKTMWVSPLAAVLIFCSLLILNPVILIVALPVLLIWFVSPLVAWWISLAPDSRKEKLTDNQIRFLRELARKTWSFFETFVSHDDNWLPPDNFQEDPASTIAHRTSPTNMGLALLANLSAFDFGYIHAGQLIERTGNALLTMGRLERFKGHFYNWYDTITLQPLQPHYISSVDSGNLTGYLMVLRPGLLALPDQKIFSRSMFVALDDTLRILATISDERPSGQVIKLRKQLKIILESPSPMLSRNYSYLVQLTSSAYDIKESFSKNEESEAGRWANSLHSQCRHFLDEMTFLAPWLLWHDNQNAVSILPFKDDIPTLRDLSKIEIVQSGQGSGADAAFTSSPLYDNLALSVGDACLRAGERITSIEELAIKAEEFTHIEYDFLYNNWQHLLSIGYNAYEHRNDHGYYDLLASEARFSTFIAIAQGQIPQESWFAMGRLLTATGGDQVLLSWSGSMFEYLMPLLVMPVYEDTLLDQTCKAVVSRQIAYGRLRGIPWGFSESGYNMVDVQLNYQYKAFGVPGMGLKRGLAEDLVVAPYASMLALMVSPVKACNNLERLAAEKFVGKYGFYEAIDYTTSRMPRGKSRTIIQSFMAHHQGMSLLSMAHLILDRPMQKRLESDPRFKATILLLQERIPTTMPLFSYTAGLSDIRVDSGNPELPVRIINNPDTTKPEVHLLSNGKYNVMVTNAGGGYSSWKDIAITRWREDPTCDNWGMFCYIRDLKSGDFWSSAFHPTLAQPDYYEAIFSKGRVEFRRRDKVYDTHTEIVVSPEDDIELRRMHITNRSRTIKKIDITSYAEVVISSAVADALHQAFSKLFVQTEIIEEQQAILCTRRPRSVEEKAPWMFHMMTIHGGQVEQISYETDRMQFIGRGRTVVSPLAMSNSGPLSGSSGSVLDPIVAIRLRIVLGPEESVKIDIVSGISDTREGALSIIKKYHDRRIANRVFELSWTYSQVVLRQINALEQDAQMYGQLASSIIYTNSTLRADPAILMKNRRGQSGLWGYSISGDLPIVLLKIEDPGNINLVRQLVQAHAYWRLKGLSVDLVIWNEDHGGYRQLLNDQMMGLIASGVEANIIDKPGGIFIRLADQISDEDRILFQTVARVIISDRNGSLAEQIKGRSLLKVPIPLFIPGHSPQTGATAKALLPVNDLTLFNGIGGFTPGGNEYVIITSRESTTPAPWVNVIANPHFGTVISESGSAYTWNENAHEMRLTPWHNDPVCDSGGEVFYIRDEETGNFWCPTPLPKCGNTPYITRHGFGYTVFEHTEEGIRSELWVYVAMDAAVKFSVLKLKNESGRSRNITVTGYTEWVLGDLRPKSIMYVTTELDQKTGAIFASNHYNPEFINHVAFFHTDETLSSLTCDRTEFIGRNRNQANPAAMTNANLSGKRGAAMDPCTAFQISFKLAEEEDRELVFRLGAGRDAVDAGNIIRNFAGPTAAHNALDEVQKFWKKTLGKIQIETPDQSINLLTNGWLIYQTLACRVWARSGYYQSGGAYGFRDQLQDMLALIHIEPELVRKHLLLCASRQFIDGDVQHWWHPPSGRGVRTHCSDDYLWLPLVISRYVMQTGDDAILEEQVYFLEGNPLKDEDDSYFDLPGRSDETASLYQHCVRAIKNGLKFGIHGLPLIGSGDWNDGMNLIGMSGKGESVWLGFFMYEVLMKFAELADKRNDTQFAGQCRQKANNLSNNIEKNCWDGEWYLRAWFDDGTPLGSSASEECKIDSIPQSWSVLSGAGDINHSRIAMESFDKHLVRRNDSLIQLLEPPFDTSDLNPGYIKGYVPGVRENGGQYTHAAIWAAMAFAKAGDNKRAWELLSIINPLNHSGSAEEIDVYKVEPYVVAADVYAVSPHIGRGGWTWYTGSAGLMYRLVIESLLGLRLEVNRLHIEPCIPAEWTTLTVHYMYQETKYNITIKQLNGSNVNSHLTIDGVETEEKSILLTDDHKEHFIEMKMK